MRKQLFKDRLLLLLLLLGITASYYLVMGRLIAPLTSQAIVGFELAGTAQRADAMMEQLSIHFLLGKMIRSVYLDYGFIALYVVSIATMCIVLAGMTELRWLRISGYLFALVVVAAGCCDVLENYCMLHSLEVTIVEKYVQLAARMAMLKFALLVASLIFVLFEVIVILVRRQRQTGV